MGDVKGFLKVKRQAVKYRLVGERIKDYREVVSLRGSESSRQQSSRCMDCGTPFCHWGCPLGNYIPEWNDLVFRGQWQKALALLGAANNFPEITGRLCPALCEYSCVLGINDDPVTIRENELDIIEYAFDSGLIKPRRLKKRTGREIAVVGSGPAGLACADQLNQTGHSVVVFEKSAQPGGLLRYGIPDFKLEKRVIDRRLEVLKKEGIVFKTGIDAGRDYPIDKLSKDFSAVCLAAGSSVPRDLNVAGRELKGIHFALDYLIQANIRVGGGEITVDRLIDARDKKVVIIGGGDTGADCLGTAQRQGAKRVTQIELLAKPPECRTPDYPWPKYPLICKTSTSHEEGGIREWSVSTKKFIGEKGWVRKLVCRRVNQETEDREFEIEADLVIIAMGFLHPEHTGLVKDLDLQLDSRGNVKTDENYMVKVPGVFSSGDMRRGQSLVVWAVSEGRKTAHCIDKYLMGTSNLPMFW
ncbi:MAG: glutamate synthase subunit beta [Candidatus Omnitrophota bacterium]